MPDLLDLGKAKRELEAKDLLTIERETALTWGGRAAASYSLALEEDDHAERMRCFWEAETYRAEAIEHAAMAEDTGFVGQLTAEIERHRSRARDLLVEAGHGFVRGNRTPKARRPEPSRAERLAVRSQPAAPAPPQDPPTQPLPEQLATGMRPAQQTPGLGRRAQPDSPAQ